jgi:hypothetical protein
LASQFARAGHIKIWPRLRAALELRTQTDWPTSEVQAAETKLKPHSFFDIFRTSETDPAYNSVLAISLGGFGFDDRQNRLSPKLKSPKKFSDSSTGLGRATGRRHRPLPPRQGLIGCAVRFRGDADFLFGMSYAQEIARHLR